MSNTIEDAFRGAGGAIEHLVRMIVRDELRQHLGPEGDYLMNVKNAPMSANKLRRLVRSGELRGYKQGRDTFVSASQFRAFIEQRPVPKPTPVLVPEPPHRDRDQDLDDEVKVALGLAPADPGEHRAFEAGLAQRRAEGGERAAALQQAEQEHVRLDEASERSAERAAKRAEKKRLRNP